MVLRVCKTQVETYYDCSICKESIYYGDEYFDDFPASRTHRICFELKEKQQEKQQEKSKIKSKKVSKERLKNEHESKNNDSLR